MIDWHLKHLQQRHVSQWEVSLAGNDWFIAPITGVVSRGFYAHWHVWCSRFNKALYQVGVVSKKGMRPSAKKSLSGLLKNLFVSKVMVISRNCKVRYLLPGAKISYLPRKNCCVKVREGWWELPSGRSRENFPVDKYSIFYCGQIINVLL